MPETSPETNVVPFARPPGGPLPCAAAPSAPARSFIRKRSHSASPVETGGRRGEYGIGDLARQLRMPDWSIRTIVRKLRVLADEAGMPLPTTPRIENGQIIGGPGSIHYHSRWDAARWDAWLLIHEQGLTPGGALPAPIVPPPIRAHMARLAEQIGAGQMGAGR